MNIRKEIYDRCVKMIDDELWRVKRSLDKNRMEINRLSKEQRILKAESGRLHKIKKELTP